MCQQTNCGCSETTTTYNLCNNCPPETCTCPVEITTNCITLAEDLSCSGVVAGTNFTEALQQFDEFVCDAVSQLGGTTNLISVGDGAEIYKGIDGLGRREIKSITSTDDSITITENTNSIDLSVNFPEVDQNNFVRQLLIERSDLPEPYNRDDICDYILALPSSERTILDTDSKWNIIVALTGDGIIYLEVYELQNIGKGVITTLTRDNLLLLKKEDIGFQAVLNVDSTLTDDNIVIVESKFDLTSGTGGTISGIKIYDISQETSTIPFVQIGKNLGNTGLIGSLQFFSDRIVLYDGLNKGIEYNGDYEANFTDRSLITKQFYEDNLPIVDGTETKVIAGTNTTVTGNGSTATPYVVNATGADGSETKINAGTNISVTGTGTTGTPYVINNTLTVDGSETKINSGTTTTVSGSGTTGSPYIIETANLQKVITYPTDFTGTNYTLTNADNNYEIIIDNDATAVSITVPTGLVSKIGVGFTQKGTADVSYTASGTTINNPIGLKIKGQYYQTFLSQELATNIFYLGGNTKS